MALLMCGALLYAQDVIIKTDGSELKGKVTEVATDVIKYHRADNLQGPLYSLPKTEVFMVLYANGTRETFSQPRTETKPAAPVAAPALSKYDSLMRLSKSNRTAGIISAVLAPIAIAGGAFTIHDALYNLKYSMSDTKLLLALGSIQVICGGALAVLAPIALVKSKKQKQAAELYKTTSAIITYPMPAMVQGKAPGMAFSMRF